jgi:prepilin-type N-terminal cleavage/methylation domain-containing protein/prepilin-type processing-associated H-X9-DG protein
MRETLNHTRRAAFTLIELLVVIAIIAILASILFPVFAQAREKARGVTCLTNQKQLALGLVQYLQDYDETYPRVQYYDVAGTGRQIGIPEMLFPYTKQGVKDGTWVHGKTGIYSCPTSPAQFQPNVYGFHLDVFSDGEAPWNSNPFPVVTMAQIDAPAEKIGIMEKGINEGNSNWLNFATWEWDWIAYIKTNGAIDEALDGMQMALDTPGKADCDFVASANLNPSWNNWATCSMMPRFRHNKTANVVFLDGHSKAMPRGGIKWYKNIYVPAGNALQMTREGWYPY